MSRNSFQWPTYHPEKLLIIHTLGQLEGCGKKLFFSYESQWTITFDRLALYVRASGIHCKLLGFWPNSLRVLLGQSKCSIRAIFKFYGQLQFERVSRRICMAAAYVTRLLAKNPKLPGPTGI